MVVNAQDVLLNIFVLRVKGIIQLLNAIKMEIMRMLDRSILVVAFDWLLRKV